MPPRSRSFQTKGMTGTIKYPDAPLQQVTRYDSFGSCSDVVGDFGGNHPLNIERHERNGIILYRTLSNGNDPNWIFTGEEGCPIGGGFVQSDWYGAPPLDSYRTRLLAQTGPLTPRVMLPLAIFELRELPDMIRHAGNLLHKIKTPSRLASDKEAAAATLAYQFGWAPIMQDLGKLLDFSESVRRKQRQLKGAHTKKGVRSKVNLDVHSKSHAGYITMHSGWGMNIHLPYSGVVRKRTWGTVRWRVRDPNAYGREPSFNEAFNAAMGLNPGMLPIYVWKSLPWTWMVDWFTDISNVLIANYNSIYYEPFRLNIMRETIDRFEFRPVRNGPQLWHCTGGNYVYTRKERMADNSPTANVTLRLPFLDNFKASVLGSLAILKVRGR